MELFWARAKLADGEARLETPCRYQFDKPVRLPLSYEKAQDPFRSVCVECRVVGFASLSFLQEPGHRWTQ